MLRPCGGRREVGVGAAEDALEVEGELLADMAAVAEEGRVKGHRRAALAWPIRCSGGWTQGATRGNTRQGMGRRPAPERRASGNAPCRSRRSAPHLTPRGRGGHTPAADQPSSRRRASQSKALTRQWVKKGVSIQYGGGGRLRPVHRRTADQTSSQTQTPDIMASPLPPPSSPESASAATARCLRPSSPPPPGSSCRAQSRPRSRSG